MLDTRGEAQGAQPEKLSLTEQLGKGGSVYGVVGRLIDNKEYGQILSYIDKLPFLNQEWLVEQAIADGHGSEVQGNIEHLNEAAKKIAKKKTI